MNNNDNNTVRCGICFTELLGIVFIVLKLIGVIKWSWWLVLLPIYGPFALLLIGVLIIYIYYNIKK